MKLKISILFLGVLLLFSGCGSKNKSLLVNLPKDATTDETVQAFIDDYDRAAQTLNVDKTHQGLDYTLTETTATAQVNGMQLMIDPPSTYWRVWYAGYPEDVAFFEEEMTLLLLATDSELTTSEATKLAKRIRNAAWENRNNMPSAINGKTPNGMVYSMSMNDRGIYSFWISLSLK